MALRTVDLTDALVADLPRGRVESPRAAARLLALPSSWVSELIERSPDAALALSDELAAALTLDATRHLDGLTDPSPEDAAHALSLAFAVRGLGLCRFDRFGDALMLTWTDPPAHGPHFVRFAVALSTRALSRLTDVSLHGAAIAVSPQEIRVFLGAAEACALVDQLAATGAQPGAILDCLTPGANA